MKTALIAIPWMAPARAYGLPRRALRIVVSLVVCAAIEIGCQSVFAQPAPNPVKFAIVLHGGAGLEPEKLNADEKAEYHASLKKAVEVGRKILVDGGTALDAVEQVIRTNPKSFALLLRETAASQMSAFA